MRLRFAGRLVALCLLASGLLACRCAAQAKDDPFGRRDDEASVEDPAASELLQPAVMHAPITGKPIEATRTTKVETLHGVAKPVYWEQRIFRDSEGRVRVEMRSCSCAAWIFLTDPVAHKRYEWREGADNLKSVDLPAAYLPRKPLPAALPDAPVIDGHPAIYTRVVSKSRPGLITETWYSPDLMFMLKRVIHDPRIGTTTYEWGHFKTEEPKAKLFLPPKR